MNVSVRAIAALRNERDHARSGYHAAVKAVRESMGDNNEHAASEEVARLQSIADGWHDAEARAQRAYDEEIARQHETAAVRPCDYCSGTGRSRPYETCSVCLGSGARELTYAERIVVLQGERIDALNARYEADAALRALLDDRTDDRTPEIHEAVEKRRDAKGWVDRTEANLSRALTVQRLAREER